MNSNTYIYNNNELFLNLSNLDNFAKILYDILPKDNKSVYNLLIVTEGMAGLAFSC